MAFEVAIVAPSRGQGALVVLPDDADVMFGTRARIPVRATFNGIPYRGSAMPRDIGRFALEITKAIRTEAGLEIGGTVRVVVERDMEERAVEVPDDLSSALRSHGLDGRFTSLTPSHRREYVRWITAAKRDATRANRVAKAVAMIGEGRDPP
jgi:hypothetical protein